MKIRLNLCAIALLGIAAFFSTSAYCDATIPTADVSGIKELSWLKRYEGSLLISGDSKAYDAYLFAAGPLVRDADPEKRDDRNNRLYQFKESEALEGARTRMVYVAPVGRSPLEVLRGYEQELVAIGATKRFECAADACGGDASRNSNGGGGDQSLAMKLWPNSRIREADFTNGNCAQTMDIADQRFASFTIEGRGHAMVHSYIAQDTLYCKALNDRVMVVVDVLESKPREQKMVTVSASEMQSTINKTGRVALYGIYFDTASATIKAQSKATLDEIGKLIGGDPALKLHVVGHTDSQGGLESNFDLSKRRAEAVRDALVAQYGIDAKRLSANGVSSLAPVASNADDAGRAKNRRVELVPF